MLNKALRKRSTEKARRKVLKKTLRKVILLNEALKIVFLLNKAFPKKNDSPVHKHIQESAQKSQCPFWNRILAYWGRFWLLSCEFMHICTFAGQTGSYTIWNARHSLDWSSGGFLNPWKANYHHFPISDNQSDQLMYTYVIFICTTDAMPFNWGVNPGLDVNLDISSDGYSCVWPAVYWKLSCFYQ